MTTATNENDRNFDMVMSAIGDNPAAKQALQNLYDNIDSDETQKRTTTIKNSTGEILGGNGLAPSGVKRKIQELALTLMSCFKSCNDQDDKDECIKLEVERFRRDCKAAGAEITQQDELKVAHTCSWAKGVFKDKLHLTSTKLPSLLESFYRTSGHADKT